MSRDLFGDEEAALEKQAKAKRVADPAIKRCIDLYHDEFVRRHGIKPILSGGKHAALFARMVSTWGEPAVTGVVTQFVQGNDPWAVRCGWTVEALYNVAQRMLVGGGNGTDGRTMDNVDAALRATRRRQR